MLLSNGLTNGIINAVICFFLSAEHSDLHNYMIGTLISNVILSIILIVICILVPTMLTMGLIVCMNVSDISQVQGALFRGFDCTIASILAYYLSVVFLKQKQ